MADNFEIPNWAGEPPPGLHLDVIKEDNLIQKILLAGKKSYFFGRNALVTDIYLEHASCSRVHAALIYHRNLERPFLIDFGSTHGTFIGNLRIDSNRLIQLPVNSSLRFGASTRTYIIREAVVSRHVMQELEDTPADDDKTLLGLPNSITELQNITEFNTACNRKTSMIEIPVEVFCGTCREKRKTVSFKDIQEIINLEDVDPSVGRFRNLVQTMFVPHPKRQKLDSGFVYCSNQAEKYFATTISGLYPGFPVATSTVTNPFFSNLSSSLGIPLPNPAMDVDELNDQMLVDDSTMGPVMSGGMKVVVGAPKEKKYEKEVWPGKKRESSNLY